MLLPKNFKYYVIGIGDQGEALALDLHNSFRKQILLDDRRLRPGEKFADAELMGIPYRVVISDKTLETDSVEITERRTGVSELMTVAEFTKLIEEQN